jgi:hypothetical protein
MQKTRNRTYKISTANVVSDDDLPATLKGIQYTLSESEVTCAERLGDIADLKRGFAISAGLGFVALGSSRSKGAVAVKLSVVPNYASLSPKQLAVYKALYVQQRPDRAATITDSKLEEDFNFNTRIISARLIGENIVHHRLFLALGTQDQFAKFSPIIPIYDEQAVVCSVKSIEPHLPALVASLRELYTKFTQDNALNTLMYCYGSLPDPDAANCSLDSRELMLGVMPRANYTLNYLLQHQSLMHRPALCLSQLLVDICCTLHLVQITSQTMHGDAHTENIFISVIPEYTGSGLCRRAVVASDTALIYPFGRTSDHKAVLCAHLADFDRSHHVTSVPTSSGMLTYKFELGAGGYSDYLAENVSAFPLANCSQLHPSADLWVLAMHVVCGIELSYKIGKEDNRLLRRMLLGSTHPLAITDPETRSDIIRLYQLLEAMLQRADLFFIEGRVSFTEAQKELSANFRTKHGAKILRLDANHYRISRDILQTEWKKFMEFIAAVAHSLPTQAPLSSDHELFVEYTTNAEFFSDILVLFRFRLSHPLFIPEEHSYPLKVLAGGHVGRAVPLQAGEDYSFFSHAERLLGGLACSTAALSDTSFDASISEDNALFNAGVSTQSVRLVPLEIQTAPLGANTQKLFEIFDNYGRQKK